MKAPKPEAAGLVELHMTVMVLKELEEPKQSTERMARVGVRVVRVVLEEEIDWAARAAALAVLERRKDSGEMARMDILVALEQDGLCEALTPVAGRVSFSFQQSAGMNTPRRK